MTQQDIFWTLPRDAWRLAATLGTGAIVLIAVIMHIFGWVSDDNYWMAKGLWGLLYAGGYFLIVVGLKCIHDVFATKRISAEELLRDVRIRER